VPCEQRKGRSPTIQIEESVHDGSAVVRRLLAVVVKSSKGWKAQRFTARRFAEIGLPIPGQVRCLGRQTHAYRAVALEQPHAS
jgi:hypothetical protein